MMSLFHKLRGPAADKRLVVSGNLGTQAEDLQTMNPS